MEWITTGRIMPRLNKAGEKEGKKNME